MLYVKATLVDGSEVVSEFERLRGIRSLSAEVLSGRKPFPVWRKLSDAHPASGEPMSIRSRRFIAGTQIREMEVVVPTTDNHDLDPALFVPEVRIPAGNAGSMRFTAEMDVPEGATVDIDYPVNRGPDGRRFVVITRNPDGEDDVLYYLDAERPGYSEDVGGGVSSGPVDDDEDYDDEDWMT